jgi:hypothetical protein
VKLLASILLFAAACSAQTAGTIPSSNPSWNWINAGVAVQTLGNSLDWATSWKQPEANSFLAQAGGPYAGDLYRTGTPRKFGIGAGVTAASYLVGWKWPRTRKAVGILNLVLGGVWTGAALSNVARNPYYR